MSRGLARANRRAAGRPRRHPTELSGGFEFPDAQHRTRGHRGVWWGGSGQDGALPGKMAQPQGRARPLERDGECDGGGVSPC